MACRLRPRDGLGSRGKPSSAAGKLRNRTLGSLGKILAVGFCVAGVVVALADETPAVLLDGSRSVACLSVGEHDHRLVHSDHILAMVAPAMSCPSRCLLHGEMFSFEARPLQAGQCAGASLMTLTSSEDKVGLRAPIGANPQSGGANYRMRQLRLSERTDHPQHAGSGISTYIDLRDPTNILGG